MVENVVEQVVPDVGHPTPSRWRWSQVGARYKAVFSSVASVTFLGFFVLGVAWSSGTVQVSALDHVFGDPAGDGDAMAGQGSGQVGGISAVDRQAPASADQPGDQTAQTGDGGDAGQPGSFGGPKEDLVDQKGAEADGKDAVKDHGDTAGDAPKDGDKDTPTPPPGDPGDDPPPQDPPPGDTEPDPTNGVLPEDVGSGDSVGEDTVPPTPVDNVEAPDDVVPTVDAVL